jgi:hypothetical protein
VQLALAGSALGFALAACSHRQRPEGRIVWFSGMCDASGAVPLSTRTFAVADDEDNVIRVYDAERGGAPLSSVDLSPMLRLAPKGKRGGHPELDIEAATRLGDLALWLTSHGRNAKGKLKPERRRLFATSVSSEGALQVHGEPYEALLDDLLADPRYAQFGLSKASERAPKSEGGLNLEGMTARLGGGLLIGFRSPIVDGKALVATLLNPEQVVLGEQPAQFGPPQFVPLGGRGVRGLSAFRDRYLILAGDTASGRRSVLYTWDGQARVQPVQVALGELNPEAFFTPDERTELLLLSDDGTEEIGGVPCKDLKVARDKRFRGLWVQSSKLPR